MNKRFWASTFTLTGTILGAGILGLPYVFSRSGFWIGSFWLFILGAIMLFVLLALGEVTLKFKDVRQLPGYASEYLGSWGGKLMFFAMIFGVYSALVAYLIGEGESFSQLFLGHTGYALYFAIGFWISMSLLLREGLRALKKVETWGVLAIIFLMVGIFVFYFKDVEFVNLSYFDFSKFFLPFGVVLFAMLGYSAVPEMRRMLKGQEKLLKNSIIFGTLIPVVVYFIFTFIFLGILGVKVPEVATIAFGKVLIIFGVFTMMTSYFVLSFAMKDAFRYDYGYSNWKSFLLVIVPPLLIYLFVAVFGFMGFVSVLGIGGVISGGGTAILVLLTNLKAKKKKKTPINVPMNWFIVIALSLIFVLGVFFELGLFNF